MIFDPFKIALVGTIVLVVLSAVFAVLSKLIADQATKYLKKEKS